MHDLITLGEVLLRLAVPSPARFESVRALDVQIGGAEANVAAACARLGLRTAWISALPDNPWGERVRRELVGHGIDCAYVRTLAGTRLGLYFLEYGVAARPVHVSGVTPALGANARALVERVFDEAAAVSFDVNYRAALWPPAAARAFAESVMPRARHVFLGRAEAQTVFGLDGSAEAVLDALARRAPKATIALLQGGEGSTVLDGGRIWRPTVRHAVQVVDPIGAGDAYVGGYLWATLGGRGPQEAVDVAATASCGPRPPKVAQRYPPTYASPAPIGSTTCTAWRTVGRQIRPP